MATPTYDLLDSTTLSASATSVTFSSLDTIASGYRDLVLVADVLAASGSTNVSTEVRLNNDSGSNYAYVFMRSNASSAAAPDTTRMFLGSGAKPTSTDRGLFTLEIFDFSQTDKHKSAIAKGLAPADEFYYWAHRWANTNAITSLEIFANTSDGSQEFASTSTFYLYGIAG